MQTASKRLLVGSMLISFGAFAEPHVEFDELAKLVERSKAAIEHQTGTAIAVVKDGKIIYEGYFGYADIQKKTRVDRNTAFYIASATKPFLALNTLLQMKRAKLDSAMSLQAMFPQIVMKGIDAKAISIRDLLTHTSGIDNQPLVWATAFSGIHDAQSRYQLVAQSYANQQSPHGAFDYTNVGYNIVSVWLDRKFQSPWQRQLGNNIFLPLAMTHSTAAMSEATAKTWQIAKPYSVMSANKNASLYLEKTDQTMQAAGGMVASAPDLARFLIMQLGQGKLDGKQVLPRSVIAQSQLQQTPTDGAGYEDFKRSGYAWGWYVGEYKGKQMLHHFGAFAGFHAHLSFIPEANVGLVVLNNEDFLAGKVTNLIADYVYGTVLHEPNIDAKVSGRFDALLEKAKGLDNAVAQQQKSIHGRNWDLSLPKDAYVGHYTHPLLGDLYINSKFQITWGQLTAVATAYELKDHARIEFVPNSGQVMKFVVKDRKVEAIEFEKIHFSKVP
jgi:CubicO group peptidase (beta-lactamase class C family)